MDIPEFVPQRANPPRTRKPDRRTTSLSSSSGESESGDDDGSEREEESFGLAGHAGEFCVA